MKETGLNKRLRREVHLLRNPIVEGFSYWGILGQKALDNLIQG